MDFREYIKASGKIISDTYLERNTLRRLTMEFGESGYVKLPNFYKKKYLSILQQEAERLSEIKKERDFIMPGYNTPRLLSVIGGKQILKHSFILSALYLDRSLKSFLSSVVSRDIYNISHEEEFMVMNIIEKKNGTHGWHVDDPEYALITILKAPEHADEGGYLEMIPDWEKHCEREGIHPIHGTNEAVKIAYKKGIVKKIHHNTGDCYLLNAGKCLHRVAPISGDTHRVILNMAFDYREDVEYGNTADELYGSEQGVVL